MRLPLRCLIASAVAVMPLGAQSARVVGTVHDERGAAVGGALVIVEGGEARARADSLGAFAIVGVAPGPQVLRATHVGFVPARERLVVPVEGVVEVRLVLSRVQRLQPLVVTADPTGRARGELATASVIDREAIDANGGASAGSLLELVPGTPLSAPGLDAAAQASLRAAPMAGGEDPNSLSVRSRSAEQLAAFGTPIIVDGVPVSNNANLQSLGVRGELGVASTADGGIDLRRIPAATVERIEVLRGVPSVRYGDLTTAAILIETRAGAASPTATLRWDSRTAELTALAGRESGTAASRHTVGLTGDLARTRGDGPWDGAATTRGTLSLAHRWVRAAADGAERLTADTRLDLFDLSQRDTDAGQRDAVWSEGRETGLRLSSRVRLALPAGARLELTSAVEAARQESESGAPVVKRMAPLSDRLTPGRAIARFVGDTYPSTVRVRGAPSHVYGRAEAGVPLRALGFGHLLRVGGELRREATSGEGLTFDPRYPPQRLDYRFDPRFPPRVPTWSITGWDRPRRFDDVVPLATSSLYLDDWAARSLFDMALQLQGGVRLDVLHERGWWGTGVRDLALQPRLTAELAPRPGLRLRASAGRVAKAPSLADLRPAAQWFDVPNVVWMPPDTAEWLGVVTTFAFDPTNSDLGYAKADKVELGVEVDLGAGGVLSLSAYDDRTAGAVGIALQPSYVTQARYALDDSSTGTGRPPGIVEPAYANDTLPVLLQQPTNNVTLASRGLEVVLATPELPRLRTALAVQGAWQRSRLRRVGIEVGPGFEQFQIAPDVPRTAYWDGLTRVGERALVTARLTHRQPRAGVVVAATAQHALRDRQRDIAGTDTLEFSGYITRTGRVVPVPRDQVYMGQYQDLRHARRGYATDGLRASGDWLLSLSAVKELPRGWRAMAYAFNLLDRRGSDETSPLPRPIAPRRVGVQLTAPLGGS